MIEPTWSEVLNACVARHLRNLHTAIPAVVKSYDPEKQTASVEIPIKLEVREGEFVEVPPLDEVPVLHPRGGGYFIHVPLAAGDAVLLVFCEADPSAWIAGRDAEEPPLKRRHGLFPFAIPGAFQLSKELSPPAGLSIGREGGPVLRIDSSGIELNGAADFVALASKVDAALNAIVSAFNSHTHVSAAPGSPTATAVPPISGISPTGSTTVKSG